MSSVVQLIPKPPISAQSMCRSLAGRCLEHTCTLLPAPIPCMYPCSIPAPQGKFDVSDTLAAALWVLDISFNIMQAGGVWQ